MFFCPQKIRLLKLSVLFLLPSSFGIWFFIWLSLIVVFPFLLGFLCNLHYIFVDLARIMTGSSICQQMSDIGWHPLPGATKIYPRVSGDVLTLASTHFWEWKSVSVMVVGHKSLLYMLPLKVRGTWSPWFLLCGIFSFPCLLVYHWIWNSLMLLSCYLSILFRLTYIANMDGSQYKWPHNWSTCPEGCTKTEYIRGIAIWRWHCILHCIIISLVKSASINRITCTNLLNDNTFFQACEDCVAVTFGPKFCMSQMQLWHQEWETW